ncbi:MAG: hypothetical protein BWY15_01709 [Firmicutes bacterium ADurb.Bin193]|nr:MAG: hypothetical protein BWY15_01709 [Firmicutes bacterium ADurb.Bin193]
MKKILILCMAVIVLMLSTTAAFAETRIDLITAGYHLFVANKDGAKIYSKPTISSTVEYVQPYKTQLEVVSKENNSDWIFVKYYKNSDISVSSGYVSIKDIETKPDSEVVSENIAKTIYYGVLIIGALSLLLSIIFRKKGGVGYKENAEIAKGALICCPQCSKKISNKADSCPHCGHPIAVNNKPQIPHFTAGVLLSQAMDAEAKMRENERELLKTQKKILEEMKKKNK